MSSGFASRAQKGFLWRHKREVYLSKLRASGGEGIQISGLPWHVSHKYLTRGERLLRRRTQDQHRSSQEYVARLRRALKAKGTVRSATGKRLTTPKAIRAELKVARSHAATKGSALSGLLRQHRKLIRDRRAATKGR